MPHFNDGYCMKISLIWAFYGTEEFFNQTKPYNLAKKNHTYYETKKFKE